MAPAIDTLTAALLPAPALTHPAFDPLRPWLRRLGENPCVAALDALLDTGDRPVTATGCKVHFRAPAGPGPAQYEEHIHRTGEVTTRSGNLHDVFNALAWMAFPRTKAALNARHAARLLQEGKVRGPLRDLLTLIDESGVIVACAAPTLARYEALVRAFSWQELFWHRRAELQRDARFVLVGHAAFEKALTPYAGITCKALFLPVAAPLPDAMDSAAWAGLVATLDWAAARWVEGLPDDASPKGLPPLPVFGYPGWLPEATGADFFADRRWFRAAPGPDATRQASGKTQSRLEFTP
ncbi:MAG: DUF3025 domain-containing protein [Betaproteobacteria bacterium]